MHSNMNINSFFDFADIQGVWKISESGSLFKNKCITMHSNMNINSFFDFADIQGVPRVKVTTSGECSLC